MEVVSCLRAVLQQPYERVELRNVIHDLIAAEGGFTRRIWKSRSGIHESEIQAAIDRNRGVPVAGVDHRLIRNRAAGLVDIGGSPASSRLRQFGVYRKLDVVART